MRTMAVVATTSMKEVLDFTLMEVVVAHEVTTKTREATKATAIIFLNTEPSHPHEG